MKEKPEDLVPTIRGLFPALKDDELRRAEEDFRAYVEATVEIYEAICRDPVRYEQFKAFLTARRAAATMKEKLPENKQTKILPHQ